MVSVSRKQFEAFVHEGIAAIPEKFRAKIGHVAFIVEDEPTAEQLEENDISESKTLLGLFEGVTFGEEKSDPWNFPPRIVIFKKPTEECAETIEDVKKIICDTVWHEIAHYLGMEEHEVMRAEDRRARGLGGG